MMNAVALTTAVFLVSALKPSHAQGTEYGVPLGDTTSEPSSAMVVKFVPDCMDDEWLTFVKVSGFQPRLPLHPLPLYASTYGSSITAECYNRCREAEDCSGYILEYATASCFKVQQTPSTLVNFVPSPGVSYFYKACLPLPSNCSEKAWSVELVPGYSMVGQQISLVPVDNRTQCMQACVSITTTGSVPCRSANFNADKRTCTLSSQDRWTNPTSFSNANPLEEYIENVCVPDLTDELCWHPPRLNETSLRADLQLFNVSEETCKDRCTGEMYFRCRAFSYLGATYECLLHSDAALSEYPGPPLNPQLEPAQNGEYVEAMPCSTNDNQVKPNVTVQCDKTHMNVTLYRENFEGRMSVSGRANECTAWGRGGPETDLIIPLPSGETVASNPCNVQERFAMGDVNRTWATTQVIVQRHKLIEQAGDFVVNVNCFLTEGEPSPTVYNISLSTGYSVNEVPIGTEISGEWGNEFANASEPRARMLLLDTKSGELLTEVSVGRPVTLRVIIDPPYNTSNVWVRRLIARSGDGRDSIWLLDDDGCPSSPTIFPGLLPTSEHTLDGNFHAFRFTPSPVLNIFGNLTVYTSPVVHDLCQNGAKAYGRRRKRSTEAVEEVPLHLSIVVHSLATNETASPILQASFGGGSEDLEGTGGTDLLCMSFLTASLLALFFLLLQSTLLTVFCVLLRRKERERPSDTISLGRDFDLPPRHVTFADDVLSFPRRDLRLSTPMKT